MKIIQTSLLLLFFLILSSVLPAQTPGAINHQMYPSSANNVSMQFQNTENIDEYYHLNTSDFFSVHDFDKTDGQIVRVDSTYGYEWSVENSEWSTVVKEYPSYYEDGRIKERLIFQWSDSNLSWKLTNKDLFVENDGYWEKTCLSFDENENSWVNTSMSRSLYNEFNYIIDVEYYNWNTQFELWEGTEKKQKVYNEDLLLLEEYWFGWDTTYWEWKYSKMRLYEYDGNGLVLEENFYHWDIEDDSWIINHSIVNTYDDNNRMVCFYIYFNWDEMLQEWTTIYHSLCNYFEYKDSTLTELWTKETNLWCNYTYIINTYDEFGESKDMTRYIWKSEESIWKPNYRLEHIYNEYGYELDWASYSGVDEFGNWIGSHRSSYTRYMDTRILTDNIKYDWDAGSQSWIYKSRRTYFISEINSMIEKNDADDCFHVYPNPTDGKILITCNNNSFIERIDLFSLGGQLVFYCDDFLQNEVNVDLDEVPSGIYILNITTENSYRIKKIIVQ